VNAGEILEGIKAHLVVNRKDKLMWAVRQESDVEIMAL